jgi:hypothetical protein
MTFGIGGGVGGLHKNLFYELVLKLRIFCYALPCSSLNVQFCFVLAKYKTYFLELEAQLYTVSVTAACRCRSALFVTVPVGEHFERSCYCAITTSHCCRDLL